MTLSTSLSRMIFLNGEFGNQQLRMRYETSLEKSKENGGPYLQCSTGLETDEVPGYRWFDYDVNFFFWTTETRTKEDEPSGLLLLTQTSGSTRLE